MKIMDKMKKEKKRIIEEIEEYYDNKKNEIENKLEKYESEKM